VESALFNAEHSFADIDSTINVNDFTTNDAKNNLIFSPSSTAEEHLAILHEHWRNTVRGLLLPHTYVDLLPT
jgi:hypothetical protein